jgi:hypothetical protein
VNLMAEKKVFIAGSRRLSRLNNDLRCRLDKIIEKRLTIVVGDANGADKAVQSYLAERHYPSVTVFCAARGCRNNVGGWPIQDVPAAPGARGFDYYAAKDRVMAAQADYGLMLWDGHSRGTLTNIVDLVNQRKPVAVYVAPTRQFATLHNSSELTDWLSGFDTEGIDLSVIAASASQPKRFRGDSAHLAQ